MDGEVLRIRGGRPPRRTASPSPPRRASPARTPAAGAPGRGAARRRARRRSRRARDPAPRWCAGRRARSGRSARADTWRRARRAGARHRRGAGRPSRTPPVRRAAPAAASPPECALGRIGIRSRFRPSASIVFGLSTLSPDSSVSTRVADLELAEPRQQDAGVIRDDVRDLRRPRDAERSRLQQRAQRRLVLAEAELAEALHADRAGVRRLPGHERRERVARLGVALALVER